MKHLKEKEKRPNIFKRLFLSYIPNKNDNFGQIVVKLLFIISLIALIISSGYVANYFLAAKKQENILDDTRKIWHASVADHTESSMPSEPTQKQIAASKTLLEENPDYIAWIKISNTKVDNPVYQRDDNDYYLTHNQNGAKSAYGAVYIDYRNTVKQEHTDRNLVIYGHEMKNGSMFGTLKRLRNIDFYKRNHIIDFSTLYQNNLYKIYAIFVLNASRADDNDYMYNIYMKNFSNETAFNAWRDEALQRSVLNTGVDVNYHDDVITLVTCCNDFENARLVVMARKLRNGESTDIDTALVSVNPNPRYPKAWYDKKGLAYPDFSSKQ